jgi:hypothetical protein
MNAIFIVDRREFIAWTKGHLLIRHQDRLLAPNEVACMEAERRLKAGEPVGLTINGELFSTLELIDGICTEKKINEM